MIRLCLNPPGRAMEDTVWSREKLRTQNEKTLANDVMWGVRKLKTTPTFWLRQLESVINQNRKKKENTGSRTGLRRTEAHTLESMVCPAAS